jgi:hypothetical protein
MTPVRVVEMTPVRVVEMTPVLVVEMTPVFAIVGADIAKTNVAAQRMGLIAFIVLLLVFNRQGMWSALGVAC